ncbi:MAG: HK97 gp10 family phage protein [Pseudomonadota bacterium]
MSDFSRQVRLWSEKAKKNMDTVVNDATQTVARLAQDRAPEVTGELKESIKVWINGRLIGEGQTGYQSATAQAKAGDVILVGWTAEHAVIAEYGASDGRQGHFYVRGAAIQWDNIVREAIRRLPK